MQETKRLLQFEKEFWAPKGLTVIPVRQRKTGGVLEEAIKKEVKPPFP